MERWGQCKVKGAPDELGRDYYTMKMLGVYYMRSGKIKTRLGRVLKGGGGYG